MSNEGPSLTRRCGNRLLEKTAEKFVFHICKELMENDDKSLSKNLVDLVKKKVTEIFQETHDPGNLKGEMTKIYVSTMKNSVSNIKDTKGNLKVLVDENDPELVKIILSALQNAAKKNSGDDVEGFKTAFVEEPVQLVLDKPRTMTAKQREINQKQEIGQGQKKSGGKSKGRNVKKTRKVRKSVLKKKTKYIPKKRRYALYSRKKMVGGQETEKTLLAKWLAERKQKEDVLKTKNENEIKVINAKFDNLKQSRSNTENFRGDDDLEEVEAQRAAALNEQKEKFKKELEEAIKHLKEKYNPLIIQAKTAAIKQADFEANRAGTNMMRSLEDSARKTRLGSDTSMFGSLKRTASSGVDLLRGTGRGLSDATSYVGHTLSTTSVPLPGTRKAIGQGLGSAGTTMKNVGSKGLSGLGTGAKFLGKTAASGVGALGTGAKFLGKTAVSGVGALGTGAKFLGKGLGALASGAADLASKAFSKKEGDDGDDDGGDGDDGDGGEGGEDGIAQELVNKYQGEIIEKLADQLDGTVDKIKQRVLAAITDIITEENMKSIMRSDIHTHITNHSGFSSNLKLAFVQSIFKQNQGTFAQALNSALTKFGKNKKPTNFADAEYIKELADEIMIQLNDIMVNV